MRSGLSLVTLAGLLILFTGLGYSTSIYNPLHMYRGEPSWPRAAVGAGLILTGLYVRRFVRAA
jgi:hypothetical protein